MRPLTENDKEIVRLIQSLRSEIPANTSDLLEKIYFKEEKGRALIIQTVDNYAVLYLKNTIYDQEVKKQKEITHFNKLISLLKYLEKEQYIRVITSGRRHSLAMYFVQDKFDKPEPGNGHIILNNAGDYISSPEYIRNTSDDIIYKGIFFNSEYEFLAKILNGSLFITARIDELLDQKQPEPETTASPKTKKKWTKRLSGFLKKLAAQLKRAVIRITPYIIVLSLALGIYYVWNQNKLQEHRLNELQDETSSILNQLRESAIKKNLKDSLVTTDENLTIIDSLEQSKTIHYGIDISHYDGDIIKVLQPSDSISFIICKATEGKTIKDDYFNSNWQSLKNKKIIRGAYHFFKTDVNPRAQANNFIDTVKEWEDTDIAPVADIEEESLSTIKAQSISEIQESFQKFLDLLEKKTNRIPMIYTSGDFADKYLNNSKFSRYPLWLAHYTNKAKPTLPVTWKEKGYRIWQKSNTYCLHSKLEDLDVYVGELSGIYK